MEADRTADRGDGRAIAARERGSCRLQPEQAEIGSQARLTRRRGSLPTFDTEVPEPTHSRCPRNEAYPEKLSLEETRTFLREDLPNERRLWLAV